MAHSCYCGWPPYMLSYPRYWSSLADRVETLEERNLKLMKELQRLRRSTSPSPSKNFSKTSLTSSYREKEDDLDMKPSRGSPSTLSRPAYIDYLPENRSSYPTPAFFPVAACDHPPLTRKKLPDWRARDRTPTPLAPAEHRPARPVRSKTPVPTSRGLLSPQRTSDVRGLSPVSPRMSSPRSASPKPSRQGGGRNSKEMKSQRREFDDFIEIDSFRDNEPNVPCCRTLMPSPHPLNPKVPVMPTPELDNKIDTWNKNATRLLKATGGDESAGRASSPWNFPLETKYGSNSADDQQFARLAGLSALHANAVDQLKASY